MVLPEESRQERVKLHARLTSFTRGCAADPPPTQAVPLQSLGVVAIDADTTSANRNMSDPPLGLVAAANVLLDRTLTVHTGSSRKTAGQHGDVAQLAERLLCNSLAICAVPRRCFRRSPVSVAAAVMCCN
jgi:hypothetical protein